jgi:hypothetical protein
VWAVVVCVSGVTGHRTGQDCGSGGVCLLVGGVCLRRQWEEGGWADGRVLRGAASLGAVRGQVGKGAVGWRCKGEWLRGLEWLACWPCSAWQMGGVVNVLVMRWA